MKKKLSLALCLLLLCGCAPWQLVKNPRQWKHSGFEATLPGEWMKFNGPMLFLTKDGELLQNINIYKYKIDKKDALPLSKKTFTDAMLPQEISELVLNEMSLDENKLKLSVIENSPVDIGGKSGFKLVYMYNTKDSLKIKSILYGLKKDKFIYMIQYLAADQYYFDKDFKVFNDFIDSLKIT